MSRILVLVGLLCALPHLAMGADRIAEVEMLVAEYGMVEKEYFEAPDPKAHQDVSGSTVRIAERLHGCSP